MIPTSGNWKERVSRKSLLWNSAKPKYFWNIAKDQIYIFFYCDNNVKNHLNESVGWKMKVVNRIHPQLNKVTVMWKCDVTRVKTFTYWFSHFSALSKHLYDWCFLAPVRVMFICVLSIILVSLKKFSNILIQHFWTPV